MELTDLQQAFQDLYEACATVETDDFLNGLNDLLDNLLGEDFFGTEGQSDPRKDWRN